MNQFLHLYIYFNFIFLVTFNLLLLTAFAFLGVPYLWASQYIQERYRNPKGYFNEMNRNVKSQGVWLINGFNWNFSGRFSTGDSNSIIWKMKEFVVKWLEGTTLDCSVYGWNPDCWCTSKSIQFRCGTPLKSLKTPNRKSGLWDCLILHVD